jgi:hypothetical protein
MGAYKACVGKLMESNPVSYVTREKDKNLDPQGIVLISQL